MMNVPNTIIECTGGNGVGVRLSNQQNLRFNRDLKLRLSSLQT